MPALALAACPWSEELSPPQCRSRLDDRAGAVWSMPVAASHCWEGPEQFLFWLERCVMNFDTSHQSARDQSICTEPGTLQPSLE